jgi:hypothetical protein
MDEGLDQKLLCRTLEHSLTPFEDIHLICALITQKHI